MSAISLRPVAAPDLDAIFDQMRDPESVRMAAFTAPDPSDREAFDAHMARVLSAPDTMNRAIELDGRFVGTVACFVMDGMTEVTYWIDRAFWGRGVATQALRLLLDEVPVRPLHARAASDNAGSLRVLQKVGFVVTGTDVGFASARGEDIEETILELR